MKGRFRAMTKIEKLYHIAGQLAEGIPNECISTFIRLQAEAISSLTLWKESPDEETRNKIKESMVTTLTTSAIYMYAVAAVIGIPPEYVTDSITEFADSMYIDPHEFVQNQRALTVAAQPIREVVKSPDCDINQEIEEAKRLLADLERRRDDQEKYVFPDRLYQHQLPTGGDRMSVKNPGYVPQQVQHEPIKLVEKFNHGIADIKKNLETLENMQKRIAPLLDSQTPDIQSTNERSQE